jgi:pSer/pThr/pTyr-binding forkhead associated (FHA) protein
MAKLILRGADGTTREVPLDESGSVTIGRSPECDLPIEDTQASRRHCMVVRLQSGYELTDLGSTNGTTVNSSLVKKRKLRHGDVIRIGSTEIVYHDPESGGDAAAEMQDCFLVYAKGERKGQRVPLSQQRTTIGRKETNTIVLADPVASSYHCEIVRDLNGYTIRDLGSTNGTLVNGEMVTEAQLVHGSKIRIGNTRFVFQDPAMAEIDLELAAVEDEAPEWGMMRELDLAAVRKRRPAEIVYTVLFLAILGGGGWLLMQEPGKGKRGLVAPAGNLVADFSFEGVASVTEWAGEPPGAVDHATTTEVHGEGKSALEVRFREGGGVLFHAQTIPAVGAARAQGGTRLRVAGKFGATNPAARLGIEWTGLGAVRWGFIDGEPGAGRSLRPIEGELSAPPWAGSARFGVRLDEVGTAWVDDLVVVPVSGGARTTEVAQNDFQFFATDGRFADVFYFRAPILVNGVALALDADGTERAGSTLAFEAQDDDHVLVTVRATGGGAARCALRFEDAASFLARGFRAFGTLESGETFYRSGLGEGGGLVLDGVRKLLVGESGQAFAVLGADGEARFSTTVRRERGKTRWTVIGPADGDGVFRCRLKTGLRSESQEAVRQIASAHALHQSGRMGEFVRLAQQTLGEFPFADEQLRRSLREKLDAALREFNELARDAQEALRAYDGFRDLASLDVARAALATMRNRFQVQPGQGEWGELYARLEAEEAARRDAAEAKRQEAQAAWVLARAKFHLDQGEPHTGAVFLWHIVEYLPRSPQAAEARNLLDALARAQPRIVEVLRAVHGRGE